MRHADGATAAWWLATRAAEGVEGAELGDDWAVRYDAADLDGEALEAILGASAVNGVVGLIVVEPAGDGPVRVDLYRDEDALDRAWAGITGDDEDEAA